MENLIIPEFDDIIIGIESQDDPIAQTNDDPIVDTQDQDQNQDQQVTEPQYADNADKAAITVFDQLIEKGVFTEDDRAGFDGTWEKMEETLETLPQRVLNNIIAQSPDVAKDVLRFTFASSTITRDDLKDFINTYLEESQPIEIEIETMDDARSYLEKKYTARGDKPRAIEAMLNAFEEDGELLETAKEEFAKEVETKKNLPKTEQLIANKENEENNRLQQQAQFAASISEELNATGWKPNKLTEIRQRLSNLNPLLSEAFKSPKALIKLTDFLGYYKNGDIDYSKFIQSLETPAGKDFKTKMQEAIDSPTILTKSNLKNPTESDNLKPII